MQKLHFSVQINAPREKVWDTMLEDGTYREWTSTFNEGSYYEGNWETGSEIKFLGPGEDESSGLSGMYAKIEENRLHEFISIHHLGVIKNGEVDTTSDEVKKWAPAFENYTFADSEGGTLLTVDVDTNDEYKEIFEGMWPKALQTLKELCEK